MEVAAEEPLNLTIRKKTTNREAEANGWRDDGCLDLRKEGCLDLSRNVAADGVHNLKKVTLEICGGVRAGSGVPGQASTDRIPALPVAH